MTMLYKLTALQTTQSIRNFLFTAS